MKKSKTTKAIAMSAMVALALAAFVSAAYAAKANTKFHTKSLHKTGAGLKHWYDAAGGLKSLTKAEYDTLGCKNCHTATCKACHVTSMKAADTRDPKTCLGCHQSIAASFDLSKAAGKLDIHEGKMICNDCHIGDAHDDIHGNEGSFNTKSDAGAIKASCLNCHKEKEEIKAHKVHKGKLACQSCHVEASISMFDGKFADFAKSGYKGVFTPKMDWTMLINADGKITTGRVKTIKLDGGKTFVSVEPYYTHNVTKKALNCSSCHGSANMAAVKDGKKIAVASAKGVIPFDPAVLDFGADTVVQVIGGGTALDAKQMTKMKMTIKDQ